MKRLLVLILYLIFLFECVKIFIFAYIVYDLFYINVNKCTQYKYTIDQKFGVGKIFLFYFEQLI